MLDIQINQCLEIIDFHNPLLIDLKEKMRTQLANDLKNIAISVDKFPQFLEILKREFQSALPAAGDSIGIICAQSIGEITTQMTLNSFHYAGQSIATVVAGIPRLKQILCLYNNDNYITTLRFKVDKDLTQVRDFCEQILSHRTLNDIVEKVEILKNDEDWFTTYECIFSSDIPRETSHLKLKLNKKILSQIKKNPREIIEKIQQSIYLGIHSPMNNLELLIYPPPTIQEEYDDSMFGLESSVETFLRRELWTQAKEITICGETDIQNYVIQKDGDEWIVNVIGGNINELILLPDINVETISTTDLKTVYNLLGIEAFRELIIREIQNVLNSDSFINSCHAILIADFMSFFGEPIPITRYSCGYTDAGVLSKATFESNLQMILDGAYRGEIDDTNSISTSAICGKVGNMGTSFSRLIYKPQEQIFEDIDEYF